MDPSFPLGAWTGREWCQKLRFKGPPLDDTDDRERSMTDTDAETGAETADPAPPPSSLGGLGGSRSDGSWLLDRGIIPPRGVR